MSSSEWAEGAISEKPHGGSWVREVVEFYGVFNQCEPPPPAVTQMGYRWRQDRHYGPINSVDSRPVM
ncbi:hypothetical protein E2C01_084252 [Portunus trituberculatus]|uniref:Uncharacterized protein n=1 Tax=Portunus trituberculatus TaxID=210409 RepID=A0A5B7IZF9_PORTR|nr:hypothetical protein [Portunus trituberculatus]